MVKDELSDIKETLLSTLVLMIDVRKSKFVRLHQCVSSVAFRRNPSNDVIPPFCGEIKIKFYFYKQSDSK